jgi:hypothetical protein
MPFRCISANSVHPVIACPPFKDKMDFMVNINSTLRYAERYASNDCTGSIECDNGGVENFCT